MKFINYWPNKDGRRAVWPWIVIAVLVIGATSLIISQIVHQHHNVPDNDQVYVSVERRDLEITLKQDGELDSIENIDITCPVEGQNTIQQIVPEGSTVKKGDVICVLDPTEHRQKLDAELIELEKAQSDVKWSKEELRLQEVKNVADLAAANSALALAEVDLREYTEGDYPAEVAEDQRKLAMAEVSLKKKQEELASSRNLMDHGFITKAEVEKSELDVMTAHNDREKAANDLQVLVQYKHAKDSADKQDKLTQAKNKVAQVQDENASNLAEKDSTLRTREKQMQMHQVMSDYLQKQFDNCTVKAPANGMVLYASSVQTEVYREEPIQAGAKVMEEQLIVRLPDVAKMKAVVKVPEARIGQLKLEPDHPVRAELSIVGIGKPIGGTVTKVSILPDNSQRWWNPGAKDYPIDITLDQTPPGLKPGASVNVTIHVGRLENALQVPLATVYTVGDDHYVFLRNQPRPLPRHVKVGESNETTVQILEGVSAGEEVLMLQAGQGRELLDASKIPSTTQPAVQTAGVAN